VSRLELAGRISLGFTLVGGLALIVGLFAIRGAVRADRCATVRMAAPGPSASPLREYGSRSEGCSP